MKLRSLEHKSFIFKLRFMMMMMILFVFYFLPCYCIRTNISKWTPNQISIEFNKQGRSYIFDPINYLYRADAESIKSIINKIKIEKNYEVFLFLINKFDDYFRYRIEEFLNELAYLILDGNKERDHNSVFILYSIEDRQSRIRTGKFTKEKLTDEACELYQNSIKNLLKSEKYSEAIVELFKNIETSIIGLSTFLMIFITVILVCLSCCICAIIQRDPNSFQQVGRTDQIYKTNQETPDRTNQSEKGFGDSSGGASSSW